MWRIAKLSRRIPLFAPPSDDFSLKRHDTDTLPTFSNVNNIIAINEEIVWRTEVCPFSQVFAMVVKNLTAEVPAIKNIDAVVMVYSNIVWQVKFAGGPCRVRPTKRSLRRQRSSDVPRDCP